MAATGGAADKPDAEKWIEEAEAAHDGGASYTAVLTDADFDPTHSDYRFSTDYRADRS